MASWQVPFIGREAELQAIQQRLDAWGTQHTMFLHGAGGVGKTRILAHAEDAFPLFPDAPYKFIKIIDFDEDQYAIPALMELAIAMALNEDNIFQHYMEVVTNIQLLEGEGIGDEARNRLQWMLKERERLFIHSFNEVSQAKRVVLRFDTSESAEAQGSLQHLFIDLLPSLQNVLLLVAGRNGKQLHTQYSAALDERAEVVPLSSFQEEELERYLKAKELASKERFDLHELEKMFFLVNGVPVLVDLTIEWSKRHSQKWLTELSLNELEELNKKAHKGDELASQKLAELREDFKRQLVFPISLTQSHFDHLLMVLAIVYPLDLEGIMELLDINQEDARMLLDKAVQSVAIKTLENNRVKLHDEVQRLILQYNWPSIDRDEQWKKHNNVKAIAYFRRSSELLIRDLAKLKQNMKTEGVTQRLELQHQYYEREGQLWAYRRELLRRQLAVDVRAGYQLFLEEWEKAQSASVADFRDGLLSIIQPYAHLEVPAQDFDGTTLNHTQQLKVLNLIARQATYQGRYSLAATIYEELIKRVKQDSEEYLDFISGQSNQLVRQGKIREALSKMEDALRIAKATARKEWEIKIKLHIGWIHRLSRNIEQAIQYYNDALRDAFRDLASTEIQIATIYYSRAYARALNKDSLALSEVKQAIKEWERIARKQESKTFELGRCYNAAGEIYLELEKAEESIGYFDLALDIFRRQESDSSEPDGKAEWRCKARSGRGFAWWQLSLQARRDSDKAKVHLGNALEELIWAASYAAPFDRPVILSRLGEVYFSKEEWHKAKETWDQAIKEAEDLGEVFIEFQGLINLARLALRAPKEEPRKWRKFEDKYVQLRRTREARYYQSLEGLYKIAVGNLAVRENDIDDAVRLYSHGFPMVLEQKINPPFDWVGQLEVIEQHLFPTIPPSIIVELSNKLQQRLRELDRDLNLTLFLALQEWIRQAEERLHSVEAISDV